MSHDAGPYGQTTDLHGEVWRWLVRHIYLSVGEYGGDVEREMYGHFVRQSCFLSAPWRTSVRTDVAGEAGGCTAATNRGYELKSCITGRYYCGRVKENYGHQKTKGATIWLEGGVLQEKNSLLGIHTGKCAKHLTNWEKMSTHISQMFCYIVWQIFELIFHFCGKYLR